MVIHEVLLNSCQQPPPLNKNIKLKARVQFCEQSEVVRADRDALPRFRPACVGDTPPTLAQRPALCPVHACRPVQELAV